MRDGDFIGYVNAGNLVLLDSNIYSDYLNTWPPLFSIFCVILAIGDGFSSVFIRFLWLAGSLVSLYFVVSESAKLIFDRSLSLKSSSKNIIIQDPIILIPFVIILRFVLDNMANVQINIYMLLCALLSFVFFIRKKYIWVGALLGLTISIKVYTIFILFYFIYKRELKPVAWTAFFLLLFNSISFFVFGFEQAIAYYQVWVNEVAPRSYIANFKNQSVFGAFLRLFTVEKTGHDLYANFLDLKPHFVKMLTYASVAIAAIYPAFIFREKLKNRKSLYAIFQYAIIFTAIPLLSPVAWKPYFIFLWFPYLLLYALLFRANTQLKPSTLKILKYLFWFSILLNVGSSELFLGTYFSDVLETYSVITFGTLLLLLMQMYLVNRVDQFDLSSIHFREAPNN